ncbi:MAG: hypothetical protein AAFX81_15930 [Pseudomonadota bacterium]
MGELLLLGLVGGIIAALIAAALLIVVAILWPGAMRWAVIVGCVAVLLAFVSPF